MDETPSKNRRLERIKLAISFGKNLWEFGLQIYGIVPKEEKIL